MVEAFPLFRQTPHIPPEYLLAPICFMLAADIYSEVIEETDTLHQAWLDANPDWDDKTADRAGHRAQTEATRLTLKFERECWEFTPWRQGSSPKEHREMLDRDLMQAREDRRGEADRKWRDGQRREERIWHGIEILAFGVLVSITAIVASAVGAGWEPSWWPL